jgi:PAS domain S-box-containing protein
VLARAVDQSAETVLLTDADNRIIYANDAVCRSSGYAVEDVLGHDPSMFSSGLHDAAFYAEMWEALDSGHSWHGVLVNRRRSGELYQEDTSITPVHDEDGTVVGYVAMKHDLSVIAPLVPSPAGGAARTARDRDVVSDIMRSVRPAGTMEATAGALCQAVRALDGIEGSVLVLLTSPEQMVQVAVSGIALPGMNDGDAMPTEDIGPLLAVLDTGPLWIDLQATDGFAAANPVIADALVAMGVTALGYGPIRWDGELIGVISVATRDAHAAEWMEDLVPTLAELGSFAGLLLGAQGDRFRRERDLRSQALDLLERRPFRPVFQPVVDLVTGDVVGFEALTRFDDGGRPDIHIDEARAAGLGAELEGALVEAALAAAHALPEHCWLSINFSPEALIGGTVADVLRHTDRRVVVEITEHVEVESYPAVRRAVMRLGPGVQIAVDDAGAGVASLRHILELRPDLVKLDIALVHDVDKDPARQALVAGLSHFAASTGTQLVAEGIETEAELTAVRALGIGLGQGYHLGRPLPIDQVVGAGG